MPLSQLTVGAQTASDGSTIVQRAGKQADTIMSELHGRYYEQTYRGNMYSGSVVGQVTTVGLATTYTGLVLSNPAGSGVNVVVNKAGYAFIVAFAAGAVVGLMSGFHATTAVIQTAAVTPRSQFFTGAASAGRALLSSSATLPAAPTVNHILASGLTGAITTAVAVPGGNVDLEGSLILPPGAFVAFYTSTASGAAAGAFSFSWEEVPA